MAEPAGFLIVCLLLSLGLALVAIARLRPVAAAETGRLPKPRVLPSRRRTTWASPDLDENDVVHHAA